MNNSSLASTAAQGASEPLQLLVLLSTPETERDITTLLSLYTIYDMITIISVSAGQQQAEWIFIGFA